LRGSVGAGPDSVRGQHGGGASPSRRSVEKGASGAPTVIGVARSESGARQIPGPPRCGRVPSGAACSGPRSIQTRATSSLTHNISGTIRALGLSGVARPDRLRLKLRRSAEALATAEGRAYTAGDLSNDDRRFGRATSLIPRGHDVPARSQWPHQCTVRGNLTGGLAVDAPFDRSAAGR
jgi:hypothetical protein